MKPELLYLEGMHGSTIDALQSLKVLYPKLSSGAYGIIDDYALKTCEKAVDDDPASHSIVAQIKRIGWTGTYWKKP